MKRLLSIATLYPNDANRQFGVFVARQMEALAARGDWDVTLLNPIGLPPFRMGRYRHVRAVLGTQHCGQLTVHRLPFFLLPRWGGAINPFMIARSLLPLAKRLHQEQPFDAVDAQFLYPDAPAAAAIARALGLPLAIKARGADVHYWGAKPYAKRAIVRAAAQADALLAVSDALADDFAALGLPRSRIATHYTGLNRVNFHPTPRAEARAEVQRRFGIALPPALPTQPPVLACVGALIPRKGQAFAIAALAHLPGAHLLLAGQGEDREKLERQAQAQGAQDRVHFLGSLAAGDLACVLSAANAMVLPSSSEGLANAWIEALACGTPLVIADTGGAREVVTSPDAGRLTRRDPKEIARAVQDIVSNQPAQVSVAACVERFSWEQNAAQLAAHYAQILR